MINCSKSARAACGASQDSDFNGGSHSLTGRSESS